MRPRLPPWSLLAFVTLAAGCGADEVTTPAPGALVRVTFQSQVGVLLDEVPGGTSIESPRENALLDLENAGEDFWRARAARQVEATLYRLVYRNFYGEGLGQLPLPPASQWQLTLGELRRVEIDGHDLLAATYAFEGTLLAPPDEPGAADARLAEVGGVVEEPFMLPVDPDHLLERTGYACMNESDFPPGSVDTVNARAFYDDTCEPGLAEGGCHLTPPVPSESCRDAVVSKVGHVDVTLRFERLPWDAALADAVRVGEVRAGGAQLVPVQAGLADHRLVYRYFPENSCAISEGCVGGPGWRRLLQFTATMQNVGDADAVLGDVSEGSAIVAHHMVSFSECHQHMHFNHYGKFSLGDDPDLGSKRAFCLESTTRYANNESTPLTHPYSCELQGTARGWGDDYIAGLDCQWIDVTRLDTTGGLTAPLRFHVNPDAFLCEGTPLRDEAGEPVFEATSFTDESGATESRFACDAVPGALEDNLATLDVTLPAAGGLVSEPCPELQVGPTRNCGFEATGATITCAQGTDVTLHCAAPSPGGTFVRACEASAELGAIPCTFNDALGVATVVDEADLTFHCPEPRSATEAGGLVQLYVGYTLSPGPASQVTCTAP